MLSKKQNEWKKLVVYQIYPRSFMDSNNDGIGDIKGIISKIDYLVDLGINAVWLSPCFKSPNEDNGYDISDYYDIMDEFGTLDDFKCLLKVLHKHNIKLFLDLVVNHTSIQHRWFREARSSRQSPYRDYYYWADTPITDWQSCFGGSVWQYDTIAGQYYLHTYSKGQPDLNWENPKVREEMKTVVDFWVDMGVDGFRCDALDGLSKDFSKDNGITCGPELHRYIKELFGRPNLKNIFTVGECWRANKNNIALYCGAEREELSCCFQFEHLNLDFEGDYRYHKPDISELAKTLFKWQDITKGDLLYTLFYENHDQPRIVSRFADFNYFYQSTTMLAAMLYMMDGVPFIYQGQELGLKNSVYNDICYFNDIQTVNFYKKVCDNTDYKSLMDRINYCARDNGRHPMPWNNKANGGFSEVSPWLIPLNDYKEINAEKERCDDNSILNYYKKIIKLRKNDIILNGTFEGMEYNHYCMYKRVLDACEIIVLCNYRKMRVMDINMKDYNILLNNYSKEKFDGNLHLRPYETLILEKKI